LTPEEAEYRVAAQSLTHWKSYATCSLSACLRSKGTEMPLDESAFDRLREGGEREGWEAAHTLVPDDETCGHRWDTVCLKCRMPLGAWSGEECKGSGEVSDGYHTFNEMYDHRCALFVALMVACPAISWRSRLHAGGTGSEGWWIGGMDLPAGTITYHLQDSDWHLLDRSGVRTLDRAPEWDGHTSADVAMRIKRWAGGGKDSFCGEHTNPKGE
jgi:hypothetical protein